MFAPNAKGRKELIPQTEKPDLAQSTTKGLGNQTGPCKRWAQLLKRLFDVDVFACPQCPSSLQMIAFVVRQEAIQDILNSLKMPTAPPSYPKTDNSSLRQIVYEDVP